MRITLLLTFNGIDASLQKLSIEHQKCDNADDDDAVDDDDDANGGMIPKCQPCFIGDAITNSADLGEISPTSTVFVWT